MRRSREGSHDAFGLLVLRYSKLARAICAARIGAEDVDDAVQEIFLRAFRGLARLEDGTKFRAYLGQIARNHCIDRLRSRQGNQTVSLDEVLLEPAAPNSSDGESPHQERLQLLRREVGRLPENQREVLLLFYFERLSYADMSSALGITEAAVNQRLSRARQRLRAVCGEGGAA